MARILITTVSLMPTIVSDTTYKYIQSYERIFKTRKHMRGLSVKE